MAGIDGRDVYTRAKEHYFYCDVSVSLRTALRVERLTR